MHPNLLRRFIELEVAEARVQMARSAVSIRYSLLFNALAVDLQISREELARRVGFDPCPVGGNAVMNGTAEPSSVDLVNLMRIFTATQPIPKDLSA